MEDLVLLNTYERLIVQIILTANNDRDILAEYGRLVTWLYDSSSVGTFFQIFYITNFLHFDKLIHISRHENGKQKITLPPPDIYVILNLSDQCTFQNMNVAKEQIIK